ncbi:M48 family metallopeptidase [Oleidesulfovibrio sp.]|uniref:M48 family metallopeptidase n=1 Tax=Oleidesulfovibrio sp. TaxID=2909707 RepID=UPI003A88E784
MQFTARYNDGQTPESVEITLQLTGGYLVAQNSDQIPRWALADIDPVDNWGERPLRLKLHPDNYERITIAPQADTDELVRQIRAHRGIRLSMPSKFSMALISIMLVLVVWIGFFGSQTIRFVATNLPESVEKQLGEQSMRVIVPMLSQGRSPMWCSSEQGDSALAHMQAELLTEQDNQLYTVKVLYSDVNNALALPGGTVILTSTLLNGLQSPEELSGILAHERQHIIEHHGTSSYIRNMAFDLLLNMFAGDSDALELIGGSAQALILLNYSREDETAADTGAAIALHRAGIPVSGLQNFLSRTVHSKESDVPDFLRALESYLSTHPDIPRRVHDLQVEYVGLGPVPVRQTPITAVQWASIKNICMSGMSTAE